MSKRNSDGYRSHSSPAKSASHHGRRQSQDAHHEQVSSQHRNDTPTRCVKDNMRRSQLKGAEYDTHGSSQRTEGRKGEKRSPRSKAEANHTNDTPGGPHHDCHHSQYRRHAPPKRSEEDHPSAAEEGKNRRGTIERRQIDGVGSDRGQVEPQTNKRASSPRSASSGAQRTSLRSTDSLITKSQDRRGSSDKVGLPKGITPDTSKTNKPIVIEVPQPESPPPTQEELREIGDKVSEAIKDPASPDASLWRLSSWAGGMCGPPQTAVANLWRGRHAIERVFNAKEEFPEKMQPREMGRKFTESWLAARCARSHGDLLDTLEGTDAQEICGLLMYLEMCVSLVPDLSAYRLSYIWDEQPLWTQDPVVTAGEKEAHAQVGVEEDSKMDSAGDPLSTLAEPEPDPTSQQIKTWAVSRNFKFCRLGEERLFKSKMTLLGEDVTSVRAGVEVMNWNCARDECCMVYNPANRYYYCLYQQGERQTALGILGIDEPCGFLSVSVLAAFNLKNAGGVRDKSDPYAVVRVGKEEYKTNTVYDNLHPVWNSEEFQFHVNTREDERKTLYIEVWDENKEGADVSLGRAHVEVLSLEPKTKMKKIIGLWAGGVGQVEVEVEFLPKREYGSRIPTGTRHSQVRRRHRRQKPTWGIFEQEMVYEQEIASFLSTIKPASVSATPARALTDIEGRPIGYQAKLAAYLDKGLSGKPADVSCKSCGSIFLADAVFCGKCGIVRPGCEEQAAAATSKPSVRAAREALGLGADAARADAQEVSLITEARQPEPLNNWSALQAQPYNDIVEGSLLRCSADEPTVIFESPSSELEINRVAPGQIVTAAGPAEEVGGYWMVPVEPTGAMQLDMLTRIDGIPDTQTVHVGIAHGKNIKRKLFRGVPTLWVQCHVPGKDYAACHTSKIKAVDPAWQEEHQISGIEAGDALEFTVWDKQTVMATGRLASEDFLPGGFDSNLPLSLPGATLRVSVRIGGNCNHPNSPKKAALSSSLLGSPEKDTLPTSPEPSPEKEIRQRVSRAKTDFFGSRGGSELVDEDARGDQKEEEEGKKDESQAEGKESASKPSKRRRFLTKIGVLPGDGVKKDSRPSMSRQKTAPALHKPLRAANRVRVDDPDSD